MSDLQFLNTCYLLLFFSPDNTFLVAKWLKFIEDVTKAF